MKSIWFVIYRVFIGWAEGGCQQGEVERLLGKKSCNEYSLFSAELGRLRIDSHLDGVFQLVAISASFSVNATNFGNTCFYCED